MHMHLGLLSLGAQCTAGWTHAVQLLAHSGAHWLVPVDDA